MSRVAANPGLRQPYLAKTSNYLLETSRNDLVGMDIISCNYLAFAPNRATPMRLRQNTVNNKF